jgi:negative regulator of flagellin synthesis FlgM
MVKINNSNLHGNDRVQSAKNSRTGKADGKSISSTSEKTALGGDSVQFSSKGAEVGKLVDQLKQFPDVRQDRVEKLKQKIEAGEYSPSGEDIADAILKDEK